MQKIKKQVIDGLKDLGVETGKEAVEQAGKIAAGVVTGKELVGEAEEMSQEEMVRKKLEDEEDKQKQIDSLRKGRNVEAEIGKIREEKRRQEKKKEEEFLEKLKRQRLAEEKERQRLAVEIMSQSTNPAKRKKARGSAFARGKGGPSRADVSATAEFGKKKD